MSYPQEILEKVYEELLKVRHLLEIAVRDELKRELEAIATSKERRTVWTLCDGVSSTSEIAKKAGISQRAVQVFIRDLLTADLITLEKRGYPRRKFDYIPSDWGSS